MVVSEKMILSIVIPVYDESKKIARDIIAACKFLQDYQLTGEILIIDDGSQDNTAMVAKSVNTLPGIPVTVVRYSRHRGKGYAIRTGMQTSRGEYAMFADSGLTVPYDNALSGLNLIQDGLCDIAHGSRKMVTSTIRKPQDWDRKLFSRIFRWLTIYGMKIPAELTDTQCGFKIYRGEIARKLYAQCVTDGFMFDVEVILRALKQGYRIKEFPVEWTCDRDSRISVLKSPWEVLYEMVLIKQAIAGRAGDYNMKDER